MPNAHSCDPSDDSFNTPWYGFISFGTTSQLDTYDAGEALVPTPEIFEKILEIAPSKGVRLVAVQRRPFPGSTPFTPEELQITLTGGSSDEERAAYAEARGHELANFIDRLIQKFQLPAISANGQGGSVVWGWSISALLPVWAIGNAKTLPADVQTRLGANSVVENRRLQLFAQWSTGYFTHNDAPFSLETPHDPELLEWVLHTPTVVPTVYNIPVAEFNSIASFGDDAQTDLPILFFFAKDLKNAIRTQETAAIFPKMKRGVMQGSLGPAFGAAGVWAVQDEVADSPIEVSYQIVDGGNHYFTWDNPEKTLAALLNIA
ncbi:hypothetical protein PQX77_020892 [Marasmius sp. AFHP31]|nr:hypothetical protein PQX77_020892 [Marasmius sp. AFHP31]